MCTSDERILKGKPYSHQEKKKGSEGRRRKDPFFRDDYETRDSSSSG